MMAPTAAQAADLVGGGVPMWFLYVVFLVLGSAFAMGSYFFLKGKLLN